MAKVAVLYHNVPASEIIGVYSSRSEAAFVAQQYEGEELVWTRRGSSPSIESGPWLVVDLPLLDAIDRLVNFT